MIDHTQSAINQLSIHHVGNKTNGEELYLSDKQIDTPDGKLSDLLTIFFLKSFITPEYYNFTFPNGDFTLNPVFNFVSAIFNDPATLHTNSVNLAQLLYERSEHPNIKAGDFFVVHFSRIELDNEQTEAMGIFKSENRQTFLQLTNPEEGFSLSYDEGISIDKLDKGCLIFNKDKEAGYKVCIIDKSNKGEEAHYWKEVFLQLRPTSDEYHHTKDFMSITKQFVTQQLPHEFDLNKTDKIDLLNRSVEYFKTNDNFKQEEFEEQVFQQPEVIDSFRKFDTEYRTEMELDKPDNFAISSQAVKKQARIFKSVLKLDRNFHIYIHGNRNLIEQGIDDRGRKYYKIYYEEEK